MPFIANEGQIEDNLVRFYARTYAGTVNVTEKGEMVYSLPHSPNPQSTIRNPQSETWTLKETLVGASSVSVRGIDRAEAKVNYFIGNDKSKWKTNIPTYNTVSLGEVYRGIDLSLKAYGKTMEKVFTVQPGADPKAINLKIEGASTLKINKEGELEIETGCGPVRLSKPLAYQEKNGQRDNVQVAYHLDGNRYGFTVNNFDKSLPLVIDPIIYITYLGGSTDDAIASIAADAAGHAYVAGRTNSINFPTANAYESTYQGGIYDVFVTKLSADLSSLIYSTYLGGTYQDEAYDIAVDASGNAYVTGLTNSADFPMWNAYDGTTIGYPSDYDAFVTKLSADGSSLVYSTYLGGIGTDDGWGIAVDTTGNAHVTGRTRSSDFPTTGGAFDTTKNGVVADVFVTKFNSAGSALDYSTYLGGTDYDLGFDIALDTSGNVYVTGWTDSIDFPTTAGAYQTTYGGGSKDAFVTKIDPSQAGPNSLVYSTYLGGSLSEGDKQGIDVDTAGNAYVVGATDSINFPTTPGAYQTTYGGGGYTDGFITKLSADGSYLVYSTYLGGSDHDGCYGIFLETGGTAIVAGETSSTDFPTTEYAVQPDNAGGQDTFGARLSPDGSWLVYAGYLGGSLDDYADPSPIATDGVGNFYMAGSTLSSDFPATPGAYQTTYGGGSIDAFVTKRELETAISGTITYTLEGSVNKNLFIWGSENPGFPTGQHGVLYIQEVAPGVDQTISYTMYNVGQVRAYLYYFIDVNENGEPDIGEPFGYQGYMPGSSPGYTQMILGSPAAGLSGASLL
jgi:hypothetical protein